VIAWRAPSREVITGADAGGAPHVRRFMPLDGAVPAIGPLTSFLAFDPSFAGGVRVAEGDVNGDGVPDYIAGAGPGGGPEVHVIDGATGTLAAAFFAFEPGFTGGVFVAAGDVNGDGRVDVIVGSGEGRAGEVKVYSGADFHLLLDRAVPSLSGGVHVAAGDVNADGFADLVLGQGAGGSTVTVVNGFDQTVLTTFDAYPGFLGGAWVAAGDVTGDGFADVVTGAGAGGGPHVRVFDLHHGTEAFGLFAFDPSFSGGVRVAVSDVTGDGHGDLLVGAGPGGPPEVRVFDGTTAVWLHTELAYASSFTGGVFVAAPTPVNRMALDVPVSGVLPPGPFSVRGWAFEENPDAPAIDAIHVWAVPVVTLPFGGTLLGGAVLGDARPDVAAAFGAQYASSGFHLDAPAVGPGVYVVIAFARSTTSGTFNLFRAALVISP
jgi:hypothetical protein